MNEVLALLSSYRDLPETERVAIYNATTRALRALVADVCDDPVIAVQLAPVDQVRANDYNPNRVASPEMALLEESIRADGVTMPVVAIATSDGWEVVDGFHRRSVLNRFGRRFIPLSVIDSERADRMASTIRHNRARGKHQVDLMANIVRQMLALGWENARIATAVGMSEEELLRLKQSVGVAHLLASKEYSQSWGTVDEPDPSDG